MASKITDPYITQLDMVEEIHKTMKKITDLYIILDGHIFFKSKFSGLEQSILLQPGVEEEISCYNGVWLDSDILSVFLKTYRKTMTVSDVVGVGEVNVIHTNTKKDETLTLKLKRVGHIVTPENLMETTMPIYTEIINRPEYMTDDAPMVEATPEQMLMLYEGEAVTLACGNPITFTREFIPTMLPEDKLTAIKRLTVTDPASGVESTYYDIILKKRYLAIHTVARFIAVPPLSLDYTL